MKRLHYLFIAVFVITVVSCSNNNPAGPSNNDDTTDVHVAYDSPITQRIVDSTGLITKIYNDTLFQVVPGVKETDIYYSNRRKDPMHIFILQIDLNNPDISIEAAMTYTGSRFALYSVPVMVKRADSAGHRVVAAVNADFFKVNAPWGIVVRNGKVLKDTWSMPRSHTFFGILKDGSPYIGNRAAFSLMTGQLEDALGGSEMLVQDNFVLPQTVTAVAPRTGAGVNGKGIVYFVVVDGRDSDYSNGMTLAQLARLLKACGATKAMNFDGGGSSTFLIHRGDEWEIRNRPSDGSPRAVSNAWLVISE